MKGILGILTFLAGPAAGIFIINAIAPGTLGLKEALGVLALPFLVGVFMTPQESFVSVRDDEE